MIIYNPPKEWLEPSNEGGWKMIFTFLVWGAHEKKRSIRQQHLVLIIKFDKYLIDKYTNIYLKNNL